jgi:tetratricopeptide (TPR) repeat protein
MGMFLKYCCIISYVFLLSSCINNKFNTPNVSLLSTKQLAEKGIMLMNKEQYNKARTYFSAALKNDPKECHIHFLNALSYQLEGKATDYGLLDIASAGYQSTIKFCPQEPWAYYYLGLINYQKKNYKLAQLNFAKAMKLGEGKTGLPFFKAFILSAQKNNDRQSIKTMIAQLEQVDPNSPLVKKLKALVRRLPKTQTLSKTVTRRSKNSSAFLNHKTKTKQMFLDAVFILSREIDQEFRGVNLLNGLQLQYGLVTANNRFGTSTWKHYADALNAEPALGSTGGNPTLDYSTLITHALSLPTINYNLNIFNNRSEHDQILSRPTLLARNGEAAKYFSGSEILLGVSGLNSGQVQIIPMGLTMNVTPHFMKDGSINLEIYVGRTFLAPSNTPVGTFESSATAVKDHTETKVNLHYGETVILSALSESINGFAFDKTPGLGNLPLFKLGFARKTQIKQNMTLLILVTPHKYASFQDNKNIGENDMESFYTLVKDFIQPSTNLSILFKELTKLPIYNQNKILNTDFYNRDQIDNSISSNYKEVDNF